MSAGTEDMGSSTERVEPSSISEVDTVVVGAGMAGLTCAALLAQRGERVLVCERHYLPGGLFTAFKEDGFLFNVGMEWTTDCEPGQAFHALLARLELSQDFAFDRLTVFKTIESPELDAPLPLRCGADRLRASLVAAFPHEADAIERFVEDCVAVAAGEPRARSLLLRVGIRTVEDMLRSYFEDPLLVHALCGVLAYPEAVGVLLMYVLGAVAHEQVFLPRHPDHRHLARLLHRKIRSLGGTILYREPAARIEVEDGVARGVRLASGRRVRARRIVASTDLHHLYRELAPEALEAEDPQVDRALGRSAGLSCFSLFLGLRRPLEVVAADEYSRVLLASTATWERAARSLEGTPLRVEHQSARHPGLAPPGGATLCVWATTPMEAFDRWGMGETVGAEDDATEAGDAPRYLEAKERASQIVLARLRERWPGLDEAIVHRSEATPFTYRRYTGNLGGSVSGFSLEDRQYLRARSFETPIEGLFHIGHWTVQSGVNSVMYSAEQLVDRLEPSA